MRNDQNMSQALYAYMERRLQAMDDAIMVEDEYVRTIRRLLRLRRLTLVLDEYYPSMVSEADLVDLLPNWRCHERFESRVTPPKRQPNTTQRVIREHVRLLRVDWKLPVVSYCHKKGEADDPNAVGDDARLFGYRWATNRADLRNYKKRIRPEIKEHMLAQMERYEAMDHIEGVLWRVRDNFFHDINQAVELLDTGAVEQVTVDEQEEGQ